MDTPQYITEYSGLLDETSHDLVDNDKAAYFLDDSDGEAAEDGRETIAHKQISAPRG